MFNCELFVNNMKELRLSHSLSMSELAYILKFKNKTSIGNIEKNIIYPSFEKLIDISNLFTVSIDWLVGRSSEPYNEEILLNIERELLSVSCTSNEVSFKLLRSPLIPEEYLNENTRKNLYSLPVRANIIFLLRFKVIQVKTALESTLGIQMDDIQNGTTDLLSVLEQYYCENNKKRFNEVNNFYLQNLYSLLKREQTNPVFDITKNYSE